PSSNLPNFPFHLSTLALKPRSNHVEYTNHPPAHSPSHYHFQHLQPPQYHPSANTSTRKSYQPHLQLWEDFSKLDQSNVSGRSWRCHCQKARTALLHLQL